MNFRQLKKSTSSGFTIVELLVIVVIIGILAALSIVSYTGITNRAIVGSLKADLKQASVNLDLYLAENEAYPAEGSGFVNNLSKSDDTTYEYVLSEGSYYLTATSNTDNSIQYCIDSVYKAPVEGACSPTVAAGSFVLALGGTGIEYGYSAAQTSDGGYVVSGCTNSYGAGDDDAFLTKYASDGSLTWTKTWGGSAIDCSASIVQTSDDGYAITGKTNNYGAGNHDAFLAKFTSDGTLSWNKTWGGTGSEQAQSLVQTSDGGYVITGYNTSYGAGSTDAFLAKFTSDGTLSWNKTWGGTGVDYTANIKQTSDDGYIVTGRTYSYGAGGEDAFIAKFTSAGVLSWSKTWGGAGNEHADTVIQTADGGYAIAGYTNGFGAGGDDGFIAKYTSDGTLSWNKTLGGVSSDYASSLVQVSDGGYAVTGHTLNYGAGSFDELLTRFTTDGTLLWSKTWGGTGIDYSRYIAETSDDGFIVAGMTASYGAGNYDVYAIKYESDGSVTGCSSPMCQSPTVTVTTPSATVTSPSATVTTPSATVTSPSATITSPTVTETEIVAAQ